LVFLAKALKECKQTPLVMCGGGDGTTVWALSTLDKAQKVHKFDYQFCTIPLGSGNDLSNALGWGNSFESENLLRRCVQAAASKTLTKLDRWNVLMSKNGERVPTQSPEMVNYSTSAMEPISHHNSTTRENNPRRRTTRPPAIGGSMSSCQ